MCLKALVALVCQGGEKAVLDIWSHVQSNEPKLELGNLLGPSFLTRRVWAKEDMHHSFFHRLTQGM